MEPSQAQWRTRLRRWLRPPRRLKTTRGGKFFIGMTLLVGFGAINTGNNLLYLLLGMMLVLIVISGTLSESVLRKLEVKHKLLGRPFAGHPVPLELQVNNPRARVPSFSIRALARLAAIDKKDWPSAYFLRIEAQKSASGILQVVFPRRGRHAMAGFEVRTRFPFDLFEKSREIDHPDEVLVYPALADDVPALDPTELPLGQIRRPEAGRGGDTYALRDYREGDDKRDVHWKVSARRGALVTREREREEARQITLCLYNRMSPTEAAQADSIQAQEHTISVVAGLAKRLIDEGWVLGLCTLQGRLPPGSGLGQLEAILRTLAELRYEVALPDGAQFRTEPGESTVLLGCQGTLPPHLSASMNLVFPIAAKITGEGGDA